MLGQPFVAFVKHRSNLHPHFFTNWVLPVFLFPELGSHIQPELAILARSIDRESDMNAVQYLFVVVHTQYKDRWIVECQKKMKEAGRSLPQSLGGSCRSADLEATTVAQKLSKLPNILNRERVVRCEVLYLAVSVTGITPAVSTA